MLGVDVGSASVKLLELSVRGDSHRVEFYGMAPLPPNAVVAKHISDVQAVGAAIRRLLPRASKNRRCAAAIPVASTSVSTFEVDAAFADEEVDAHIHKQILPRSDEGQVLGGKSLSSVSAL